MLKKLFICLSLLNIAAYASEDGFDHKNEAFGSVSDQKGQNAKTIELDQVNLKRLAHDFWDCTFDEDRFDDMKRIFFSIPEKWRSTVIKSRDLLLGMTPFVTASVGGNFKGVKFLLEHGADIYAADKYGHDALFWAEQKEYAEIAVYLRSQMSKDRNAENIEAENAEIQKFDQAVSLKLLSNKLWCYAKNKDSLDNMKSLLDGIPEEQRSKVINFPAVWHMSPLMMASFSGNFEGVKFLLEHGADIYATSGYKQNAYYWAERGGYTEIAEYLRSQMDKNLSAKTKRIDPASFQRLAHDFWYCAADNDKFDDMKSLLDSIPEKQRNEVVNCQLHCTTPLIRASISGNFKGVKLLVENGAGIYVKDDSGRDAYRWAKLMEQTNVAKYLRSKDVRGWYKNPVDVFQRFIENELTPDNSDNIELDEFHLRTLAGALWGAAAGKERFDDMKRIFFSVPEEKRGQVINCPGFFGLTPLMRASIGGNFEGVQFLVERGADIYAKDANGRDALSLAEQKEYADVVEYLRSKGYK